MPLYDFKCRACGHAFDELVKVGETPNCPSCGQADVERLFCVPRAISTESTRKRNLGEARRRAGKVRKEKDHAQAEYERNYYKEHGGG